MILSRFPHALSIAAVDGTSAAKKLSSPYSMPFKVFLPASVALSTVAAFNRNCHHGSMMMREKGRDREIRRGREREDA